MEVLKKLPKIDTCSAQNVLDPLLSLHIYFFIPKILAVRPENFEFKKKIIKEDIRPLWYVIAVWKFK